jgi:hypothetical protein
VYAEVRAMILHPCSALQVEITHKTIIILFNCKSALCNCLIDMNTGSEGYLIAEV